MIDENNTKLEAASTHKSAKINVGDIIPHAKIQIDRPIGASRQMVEISLSRGF